MAREADRLVGIIRRRRHRLGSDLAAMTSLEELKRQVRRAPLPWLVGGSIAGILLVRFALPPLMEHGRGKARSWVRERLRHAVLALVLASTGRAATSPETNADASDELETVGAGNGARPPS